MCLIGFASALAWPQAVLAHGGHPGTPEPEPTTTTEAVLSVAPGGDFKVYLPVVITLSDGSMPPGGIPGDGDTTGGTDAHALNDYSLAEEARKRNDPPFQAEQKDYKAAEAPTDLITTGQWGSAVQWPFVFATAANLPDGRILTWGGNNPTSFNGGTSTYASVWDPDRKSVV